MQPTWRGKHFLSCFLTLFNVEKRAPSYVTFLAPDDLHCLLDEAFFLPSSKAPRASPLLWVLSSSLWLPPVAVICVSWVCNLSLSPRRSYTFPYLRKVLLKLLSLQAKWLFLSFFAKLSKGVVWVDFHCFLMPQLLLNWPTTIFYPIHSTGFCSPKALMAI